MIEVWKVSCNKLVLYSKPTYFLHGFKIYVEKIHYYNSVYVGNLCKDLWGYEAMIWLLSFNFFLQSQIIWTKCKVWIGKKYISDRLTIKHRILEQRSNVSTISLTYLLFIPIKRTYTRQYFDRYLPHHLLSKHVDAKNKWNGTQKEEVYEHDEIPVFVMNKLYVRYCLFKVNFFFRFCFFLTIFVLPSTVASVMKKKVEQNYISIINVLYME